MFETIRNLFKKTSVIRVDNTGVRVTKTHRNMRSPEQMNRIEFDNRFSKPLKNGGRP